MTTQTDSVYSNCARPIVEATMAGMHGKISEEHKRQEEKKS